MAELADKMQAAGHCMLYATTDKKVLEYPAKAIVLMQMRFDGSLGFAGGFIEPSDPSPAVGVIREMQEELGIDPVKFPLSEENHIATHTEGVGNIGTFHFYALQVSESDIEEMEMNAHTAYHYGEEVLGWIRVPLYTMNDGYNGLPRFLNNQFVGNARQQLLNALEKQKILTPEEIAAALLASQTRK